MKKTDVFFIIDNYNTAPLDLIEYCENYEIYDSSSRDGVLDQLRGLKYTRLKNTGHNISTYFRFFIDNYTDLPGIHGSPKREHYWETCFERIL